MKNRIDARVPSKKISTSASASFRRGRLPCNAPNDQWQVQGVVVEGSGHAINMEVAEGVGSSADDPFRFSISRAMGIIISSKFRGWIHREGLGSPGVVDDGSSPAVGRRMALSSRLMYESTLTSGAALGASSGRSMFSSGNVCVVVAGCAVDFLGTNSSTARGFCGRRCLSADGALWSSFSSSSSLALRVSIILQCVSQESVRLVLANIPFMPFPGFGIRRVMAVCQALGAPFTRN